MTSTRAKPAAKSVDEVAALMDLIAKKAPSLYAAGVSSLAVDGAFSITLIAPPPDAADFTPPAPPPKTHIDPLKDASAYPGGRVPGFTRDEDRAKESNKR